MMRYFSGLISVALFTAGCAYAQVADTPKIAAKIAGMGSELSRELAGGTMKIYGPLHAQGSREGVAVTSDVVYGVHEKQKLDVYAPEGADGKAPVVVFVHGGGFVRGDKSNPDAVGVGPWLAKHGVVGITMNYRLAPEVSWPAGAEDIGLVLDWIGAHAAEFGGDASKVVLVGHSAGSVHVADYIFREDLQRGNDGVIGAVLISMPVADLTGRELDPQRDAAYYGADGDRTEQSIVNHIEGRKLPVMVAFAEFEPQLIMDQSHLLIDRLADRDGRLPIVVGVPGHNHISVAAHLGTADQSLAREILDFTKLLALRE